MKASRYLQAVGLSQASQQAVPQIGVIGQGPEADTLVSLARRFGVPVVEDPQLAAQLRRMELDESIPPELFMAVATLLAHI
ncbi:MAG: EscU/YscU/HrcU family type III secretion system export apparatus switch protein [Oligoflexia bacterium]|nr:EscU/YscU/HrcU family type III secretion system export apparatus switch protein [Oligoflexia bacterium]